MPNSNGIIDHGSMHCDASSTMHTSNLFTYLRENAEIEIGWCGINCTLELARWTYCFKFIELLKVVQMMLAPVISS